MNPVTIKEEIKKKYGSIAKEGEQSALENSKGSCCGPSCCSSSENKKPHNPVTSNLYSKEEQSGLPAPALLASMGCGNPVAKAKLKSTDHILDLGSGGGIDAILTARRLGKEGKVYGLDITDEMIELARSNAKLAGIDNVEFLKGDMEDIPLKDQSIDLILSNCVINLAPDKERVFREMHRVLKAGGSISISDIVVRGEVPAFIRKSAELWIGCIAGALEENDYKSMLEQAGFVNVTLTPTRIYNLSEAKDILGLNDQEIEQFAPLVDGHFMSALVEAHKDHP